jgi:hypothetical protein
MPPPAPKSKDVTNNTPPVSNFFSTLTPTSSTRSISATASTASTPTSTPAPSSAGDAAENDESEEIDEDTETEGSDDAVETEVRVTQGNKRPPVSKIKKARGKNKAGPTGKKPRR